MTTTAMRRAAPPPAAAAPGDRRARLDAAVRLGAGAGLWLSLLVVAYWWAAGRDAARWLGTRPGRRGLVVWADGSSTLLDGSSTA